MVIGMSGSEIRGTASPSATIFVVDDEPILLDLAQTILQPLGFSVHVFRDPKKALLAFPAAKPSLVVTDYAMGETTGMDLLRECRRLNPGQKVLLLSGTVDERIYADEKMKPNRFLPKPYQIRDFVESVQSLVRA
jgi:two-component system, OmpR family, response regulator